MTGWFRSYQCDSIKTECLGYFFPCPNFHRYNTNADLRNGDLRVNLAAIGSSLKRLYITAGNEQNHYNMFHDCGRDVCRNSTLKLQSLRSECRSKTGPASKETMRTVWGLSVGTHLESHDMAVRG